MSNIATYLEKLVFEYNQACRRPDGSIYGLEDGKQCRKGSPITLDSSAIKSAVREAISKGANRSDLKKIVSRNKENFPNPNTQEAKVSLINELNSFKGSKRKAVLGFIRSKLSRKPQPERDRPVRKQSSKVSPEQIKKSAQEKYREDLEKVKSLSPSRKSIERDLTELENISEKIRRKKATPEDIEEGNKLRKNLEKTISDYEEASKIMGNLRSKVLASGNSVRASQITSELRNNNPDFQKPSVWQEIGDLHTVTSGKVSTLKKVVTDEDRAYASKEEGSINTGRYGSKEVTSMALWHEFGHHIEYSQDQYREAAREYLISRSLPGSRLQSLRRITGNKEYDRSERAYVTDLGLGPYVGKYYPDGTTEVISMGLEMFQNPNSMLDFMEKDYDHFLFTLGILNSLQQN